MCLAKILDKESKGTAPRCCHASCSRLRVVRRPEQQIRQRTTRLGHARQAAKRLTRTLSRPIGRAFPGASCRVDPPDGATGAGEREGRGVDAVTITNATTP